jgi:hypothetical protein
MTRDPLWLEIIKVAAGAATPILVAIFGVLLLRRIEVVKALVAKKSEFEKRWAGEFFGCCQGFMQALERDLSLLTALPDLQDRNEKVCTESHDEIWRLNLTLAELELRIRRSVVFAPRSGCYATKAASGCIALVGKLLEAKKGNLDGIIAKMNEFNVASRVAHAEMLDLGAAEFTPLSSMRPTGGPDRVDCSGFVIG